MEPAIQDYCPCCKKRVEYEFTDGEYFCYICGRTKEVAEEKAKFDKRRTIAKTIKLTLKIIGIILLLLLILLAFVMVPDRMGEASSRGLGYVGIIILILIASGIFYGIKILIKKIHKH